MVIDTIRIVNIIIKLFKGNKKLYKTFGHMPWKNKMAFRMGIQVWIINLPSQKSSVLWDMCMQNMFNFMHNYKVSSSFSVEELR
jgi:hypothetical protein